MTEYKRLRGFQDILGDKAESFHKIHAAARRVFKNFGYGEIVLPILEEKELFVRALGDTTDVVQKEMYEFEDRSKTRVALRPEGTAGVVRAYLENELHKTQGLAKLFYLGPMFRGERPQAGRLRQFHQIGIEALGTDSPLMDAEAVHCLDVFLRECGITDHKIRLNNLGTFEDRKQYKEVLQKYFVPLRASLCEDCKTRLDKNVFRLLDCKVESCHALAKKSPSITESLANDSRAHFDAVRKALDTIGVSYSQDSYMVRGLDYYTKTVFEVTHSALGSQDAIAAGGRYDNLVETFGGPKTGAVGFAVGVERLMMVIGDAAHAQPTTSYFIVTLGETAFQKGFELMSSLRLNGIAADMDFAPKSMKSQMRLADKLKSDYVLILGDNELQKGAAAIKNMKDGSQTDVVLDGLAKELKKR